MGDTFLRYKTKVTTSLEPVEKPLGIVSKALDQFDLRFQELEDLQVAIDSGNTQQQVLRL